jgi:hypothetical protein
MTLYNSKGTPIAYIDSGGTIYLFRGEPVAYVLRGSVYAFSGKHLGRYARGWIRDHRGDCVFFTRSAQGGPTRPELALVPPKDPKKPRPIRGTRQEPPPKPETRSSWSRASTERFFNQ